MNSIELRAKYRQLRHESVVGSTRNYALNTICVLLQNNTLEKTAKDIQKAADHTKYHDSREVFLQFLLEAKGEY